MTKTFTFSIIFTFLSFVGLSQDRKIEDSLKLELSNARHDTSRVLIKIALCNSYRNFIPDSAIVYGEQALDLANKINFIMGQVQAFQSLSGAYQSIGNLPKALDVSFKSLNIARQNSLRTGPTLNGIGQTYFDLKEFGLGLSYTHQARSEFEAANDTTSRWYCFILMNLGTFHWAMNQSDSASYYHQKAFDGFVKNNSVPSQIYRHLGNVKFKSGNYPAALNLYHESLQISLEQREHRFTAQTCTQLAKLFKATNQLDSSIYYAKKALTEAELVSYIRLVNESAKILSELYEPTDSKEAFHYYKIATKASESLCGKESIQSIQAIVAQEEARQKELEVQKKIYQNKIRQYAFLTGLIVLLLIAFILYRSNKKEKKAKILLQKKNQVIEQTLLNLKSTQSQLIQSEKMASLGELTAGIAHEIQNPLNFVNNFSEVSNELIKEIQDIRHKTQDQSIKTEEDEILNDIASNLEKINHHGKRAADIVKGMLQHSRSSGGVKEPTDINALADEYLRLAYHGLRAKDKSFNATLKTDYDQTIENISITPQDIGRVILNLITNAFYAVSEKHKTESGKPDGSVYEPTVSVSTKKEGNIVLISVKDNGNGIPDSIKEKIFQPFFTTKPTGQGTGLGLSMSYDIVKAHGGELKVETQEGEGSEFLIQLPTL